MKISENMLNFLGFMYEKEQEFVDRPLAVGLAYPFGVSSATKNGLIVPYTKTITINLGGSSFKKSVEGYILTTKGARAGYIGHKWRQRNSDEDVTNYLKIAKEVLESS